MAMYTYKCVECGEKFDIQTKMTLAPAQLLSECDKCGAVTNHRKVIPASAGVFHKKGTGWGGE